MSYRLIYDRPDGLSIVIPAPGLNAEEVAKRCVPPGIEWQVVPTSEIPTDRWFRNAWEKTGGAVTVNMPKARDIQMSRIRIIRDKELARLDIEQLKGLDVAAQKMALRDLPVTFQTVLDAAQTPEELKNLWPEGLPHG